MDTKTAWQTLRDYAEGRIDHAWAERCPNTEYGHDIRDSDCPVCQALDAVQGCLAQIEEPAGAAPAAVAGPASSEIDWDVLPENPGERARFDRQLTQLYGGDPRVSIATALRLWAETPSSGFFGAQCAVFANEVAKLHIAAPAATAVPPGFALVPLRLTRAMDEVLAEEGWQWADLLAAAQAVTEEQYALAAAPQAPAQEAPAAPAKAAADIAAGFGSEPAKADPMREMLVRKARYWDVLQFAVLQRGIQARVFDGAPKRAPRAQFVWEVTFGNTTLNRRSLEFALWAAIKLEYEGKAIPGNLQFDLPDSTASVLVQSTQLAAAPQAPATPSGLPSGWVPCILTHDGQPPKRWHTARRS
ncbi:hypothetical protein [Delftia tsuruhatensis]|uniref:hypothetical protein n=1 Tax=Delftia tsuruhatensis TaxID=180282 RepID=UPI002AD3455F|nr:hypothetical protein [Delftia tsuruhatensis]WQM81736.1 hypothetical protein RNT40_23960 [Delftia tsuruhatensis]